MSSIHFEFFPLTLQMNWGMDIVLPKKITADEELPLVYLLHDDQEGHTIWNRMVGIERLADKYHVGFAAVDTAQGLYTDMKDGYTFCRFYTEELPKILHSNFNLLTEDFSKTLFVGKGVGGYAAAKWALKADKAPAAVLAVDPVLQIEKWYEEIAANEPDRLYRLINAWGENASWKPEENRLDCIARVSAGDKIPLDVFRSGKKTGNCSEAFAEKIRENFTLTPHLMDEEDPWLNAADMIAYGIETYLKQEV